MAPTPNVNTHLMQLRYTISALTHKLQFHVNAVYESATWKLIAHDDTHTDWKDVIDFFDDFLGPLLPVGSTAAGATLFAWSSGSLLPVDAYSYALTPGAGPVWVGFGETYFMRDENMKAMKAAVMSENISACYKATSTAAIGALFGPAEDMAEELLNLDPAHFGAYWYSLAGGYAKSFTSWVTDSNEKLRRIRGVK